MISPTSCMEIMILLNHFVNFGRFHFEIIISSQIYRYLEFDDLMTFKTFGIAP